MKEKIERNKVKATAVAEKAVEQNIVTDVTQPM
jgi:hypothetical protein